MGNEYQPLTQGTRLYPQQASDSGFVERITPQSIDSFRGIGDDPTDPQYMRSEASTKSCQRAGGSSLARIADRDFGWACGWGAIGRVLGLRNAAAAMDRGKVRTQGHHRCAIPAGAFRRIG